MSRGTALALAIVMLAGPGCSLNMVDRKECTDNDDCIGFGAGSTCGAGGYCEVSTAPACTTNMECETLMGAGYVCNITTGVCELPDTSCTTDGECRNRSGFGYVCNATSHACEFIPVADRSLRCNRTIPERLFIEGEFSNAIVFGSIVERNYEGDAVLENAAELAIAEANLDRTGLNGRTFGLVMCTDEANAEFDSLIPDEGQSDVAVARYLVDKLGVRAIFGPTTSGRTQAVYEDLRGTGTLIISPSATSPDLTTLDNPSPTDDNPGLLWRTVPPDSLQGRIMAEDMIARAVTRVAVIVETGPYGDGLANVFVNAFTGMGGMVVGGLLSYGHMPPAASLAERITDAYAAGAQEVLFISGLIGDEQEFLNGIIGQPGDDTTTIFLSDTAATPDLLAGTPVELYDQIRLTRPALGSGPVYLAFVSAYRMRFPTIDPTQFGFIAQSYDAAWMLVYGSAWSVFQDGGQVTGLGIGKGMRHMSSGGELQIRSSSWPSARGAFMAGSSIDILGASGALDYNPMTEETEAGVEILSLMTCPAEWTFALVSTPGGTGVCP